MHGFAIISWLVAGLLFQGCATYEPKVLPMKLPEAYANVQRVEGAYVAARAWAQEEETREAFGFNIIKAGLLPVQVNIDNRGEKTLLIDAAQTFLINQNQELFPVLTDREAYERVSRGAKLSESVKGLAQGGLLGGATGALIGAAIGVVAGHSAGEYAMRGAAIGGGTGAVFGAAEGATDTRVPRTIADDLNRRSLRNTPIKPGDLAYGVILFPKEAGRPSSLRLQLKDQETGQVQTLTLPL